MLFQPGIAVPLGCVLGEPAAGFLMILGTLGAGTDGGFMTLGVGIIGAMVVGTTGDGGTTIGTIGDGITGVVQ